MWRVFDATTGALQASETLSIRALMESGERGAPESLQLANAIRRQSNLADGRLERLLGTIPTWLTTGQGLEGIGELVRGDGRRANVLQVRPESSPGFELAIDDEFVLFRKSLESTDIEFEYDDAGEARLLIDPMAKATYARLEIYAILGTNSVESEGNQNFRKTGPVKRAIARLGYGTGLMIGRVARTLFTGLTAETADPFQAGRLQSLERAHPNHAAAIPRLPVAAAYDISYLPPPGFLEELVVLVHGTVSCGMRMAASLYPDPRDVPRVPQAQKICRFEHDTFETCESNAAALVERILPYAGRVPRVLLLAHSRGGLVAASAANELQHANKFIAVGIQTFGTPHAGTPLVEIGRNVGNVMEALVKTAAKVGAAALGAEPVGWVAGYGVSRLAAFPKGVQDMEVGNSYLRLGLKRNYSSVTEALAWGATFDPTAADADGFIHALMLGARKAVFDPKDPNQVPNDGVVPKKSAEASKMAAQTPLDNCDHSAYFDRLRTQIRTRIGQRK